MNTDFLFGCVCGIGLAVIGYALYWHVITSQSVPESSTTVADVPATETDPAADASVTPANPADGDEWRDDYDYGDDDDWNDCSSSWYTPVTSWYEEDKPESAPTVPTKTTKKVTRTKKSPTAKKPKTRKPRTKKSFPATRTRTRR